LQSYGLGYDLRYGEVLIDRLESITAWQDESGVSSLVPALGSRMAEELEKVTYIDFVEMPLKDVVWYFSELHGVPIELATVANGQDGQAADEIPVTATLMGFTLRDTLGKILSDLKYRIRLHGDTLVIEPRQPGGRAP
jgi:hypothetical protein